MAVRWTIGHIFEWQGDRWDDRQADYRGRKIGKLPGEQTEVHAERLSYRGR